MQIERVHGVVIDDRGMLPRPTLQLVRSERVQEWLGLPTDSSPEHDPKRPGAGSNDRIENTAERAIRRHDENTVARAPHDAWHRAHSLRTSPPAEGGLTATRSASGKTSAPPGRLPTTTR